MSTNEFWNEEPKLLWAYRKMYMDKMKIQNEISNYNAWLNGLYVFDAMSKCLFNSFGRKETQQPENYVSEPYDFNVFNEFTNVVIEDTASFTSTVILFSNVPTS